MQVVIVADPFESIYCPMNNAHGTSSVCQECLWNLYASNKSYPVCRGNLEKRQNQ